MGHVIGWANCRDTKKAMVAAEADINEDAIQQGDYHKPLNKPIRWETSVILNSRDEAEYWIEQHQGDWYDQVAVRYRETKENKTLKDLRERMDEVQRKKQEFEKATIPSVNRTSKYIGCKECGSSLAREYLSRTDARCPLCGNDLRNKSYKERIEAYRNKLMNMSKRYNELASKATRKGDLRWLIKYEYHV